MALAGCGEDDGASVRDIGSDGSDASSGSGSEAASGSGSSSSPATPGECVTVGTTDAPASTTIEVDLGEWFVDPRPGATQPAAVRFAASNIGAEDHELVIVKADSPSDLTVVDGAVREDDLPAGAFIGEIEAFAAGEECDGTFDLEAADYVLFCNIVETESDGAIESHYEEGMVTTFTVE
jgi:hypothetical protein